MILGTNWKKDDDKDDNDDWGSGWKSWTSSRPSTAPLFGTPSSGKQQQPSPKGQQPNPKGQGKTKIQPVFICATCSCAQGFCADCPDCKDHPTPPGFMWKDKVPWQSLICSCANNSQQLSDKPLGHAQDCPFLSRAPQILVLQTGPRLLDLPPHSHQVYDTAARSHSF